jgi:hypothetical protein
VVQAGHGEGSERSERRPLEDVLYRRTPSPYPLPAGEREIWGIANIATAYFKPKPIRLPAAAVWGSHRGMGTKSLFRSTNWWRWPADNAWARPHDRMT